MSALLLSSGCSQKDEAPAESPDPPPGSLLAEPLGTFPASLADVGLYRDVATRARVSELAVPYAPGFPLWSDGGEKSRFLVLPAGTSIDDSTRDAWTFPVGSLLFKTFAFKTPDSPGVAVPIETRVLRLADAGWEFAAYGWNEGASDAELLPLTKPEPRTVLADDDSEFEHRIPSKLECRTCHESVPGRVLGVNELQLTASDDWEHFAPTLEPPPTTPLAEISGRGPLTTAALGYFVGNCVHCHNGGKGAATSFDLRPDVALTNVLNVPTVSSATAPGIRVVPGKPEQSVLYLALSGEGDAEVKEMPPLGVAVRDAEGVRIIRDWITALGTAEDP